MRKVFHLFSENFHFLLLIAFAISMIAPASATARTQTSAEVSHAPVEESQHVAQAEQEAPEETSDYSYTVKPGDGVTHLLINFAESKGETLSPSEAFEIAKELGDEFLGTELTVPMNAPFTEGIGGFPEPGVTIVAAQHQDVFEPASELVTQTATERTEALQDQASENGEDTDSEQDDAEVSETATTGESNDDCTFWDCYWWVLLIPVGLYLYYRYNIREKTIQSQ